MNKNDFDNKLTSFNREITLNKAKNLEIQRKLNSLMKKDYSFFPRYNLFYKLCWISKLISLSTSTWYFRDKKKIKGTDYILSWKSNGVFNSKLKPLYTASLNSIEFSEYRIEIKFDKDSLPVEQNNYLTKIVCLISKNMCSKRNKIYICGNI